MNSKIYAFLVIMVVAFVTAFLRFLPFLVFHETKKVPKFIQYLGSVLPYSIMGMLVVYCLKDISFERYTGWLPELISVFSVIVLHVWKRNTLLSIIGGTVCYMFLMRFMV